MGKTNIIENMRRNEYNQRLMMIYAFIKGQLAHFNMKHIVAQIANTLFLIVGHWKNEHTKTKNLTMEALHQKEGICSNKSNCHNEAHLYFCATAHELIHAVSNLSI